MYCRPAEGIHVFLDYARDEAALAGTIGTLTSLMDDHSCMPANTIVTTLSCTPAAEAPPTPDPEFPFPYLCTVRLL